MLGNNGTEYVRTIRTRNIKKNKRNGRATARERGAAAPAVPGCWHCDSTMTAASYRSGGDESSANDADYSAVYSSGGGGHHHHSIIRLPRLLSVTAMKCPGKPMGLTLAKKNNSTKNNGCGAVITSVSLQSPFFFGKRRMVAPPPPSSADDSLDNDEADAVVDVDDEQYRNSPAGEEDYNRHLQPDDQILIVNSHRVRNPKLAANMIKSAKSGKLTIVVSRGKQIGGMNYCLAKINDVYSLREKKVAAGVDDDDDSPVSSSSSSSWHGLRFRSTHEGRLTRVSGMSSDNGNPFVNIGLEIGDVILCVDGVVVRGPEDAYILLEETAIDWRSKRISSCSGVASLTTKSRNASQHSSSSRVVTLLVYSLWSLRRKVLNETLNLVGENKWQVSYSNDDKEHDSEKVGDERKEYIMLRLANTSVTFRLEFDTDGKCSCHEPSYNSPVLESLYAQQIIPAIDALNIRTTSQMRLLADAIVASDSDATMTGKQPGRSVVHLPTPAPEIAPQVVEQARQRSISIDYYPKRMKKQSHQMQQENPPLNKESLGKSRPETLHSTVAKPSSNIDLSARSGSKTGTRHSSKKISIPDIESLSKKFDDWLENQMNRSNSQTASKCRQMSSTPSLPGKIINDVNFEVYPSNIPTNARPRQIEHIEEEDFELSFTEIKVPQCFDIDDDVSAITGYFEKPAQQRNDKLQRMPSIVPNEFSRSSLYPSTSDSDDDSSTSTTSSVDSSVDSESIDDDDEDEESQQQDGQASPRKSSRQNNLVVYKGNAGECNASDTKHTPFTRRLKMRIADIRESYKVSHRICGAGSFGTVRSCTHRSTRQKFAVKSITKAGNANIITLLKNELALVQRVNHRHVVMVVDVIQDLDYIHIGKPLTFDVS